MNIPRCSRELQAAGGADVLLLCSNSYEAAGDAFKGLRHDGRAVLAGLDPFSDFTIPTEPQPFAIQRQKFIGATHNRSLPARSVSARSSPTNPEPWPHSPLTDPTERRVSGCLQTSSSQADLRNSRRRAASCNRLNWEAGAGREGSGGARSTG